MTAIETSNAQAQSAREAFDLASRRSVSGAGGRAVSTDDTAKDRSVSDTVTLSESAQKVVNLDYGNSMAAELRQAPVDDQFADKLQQSTQDVFRISELFNKTIRAAFALWR